MSSSVDSQYERERLSRILRDLRAQAQLGGRDAASRAGFSQSKLSKIETGQLLPSLEDVRALCKAFGVAARERDEVLDLLRNLQDEVESARVILSRGAYRKQQEIQRIEEQTHHLRAFDLGAVIGLLQTPAYMRIVFSRRLRSTDIERALEARAARQRALEDANRLFTFVLTEGALRWHLGPSEVMREQIEHIAATARRPNIRIGVIPWTTPAYVLPGHEFHLFDDHLALVGTQTATATIKDPRDVAVYAELFAELEGLAEFDDAAQQVLTRIAADYAHLSN
jgi:transcriptional regulator with XRE-family HTH domain